MIHIGYHMNVLTDFPFRPRYYLTHPWKFFQHAWCNLQDAWHRITRGWCCRDVWELYEWFGAVLPAMLEKLGKDGCGTPCDMSMEDWRRWLTVQKLRIAYAVTETYDENEFTESYFSMLGQLQDVPDEEFVSVRSKWLNRESELFDARKEAIQRAMNDIGERFFDLWD